MLQKQACCGGRSVPKTQRCTNVITFNTLDNGKKMRYTIARTLYYSIASKFCTPNVTQNGQYRQYGNKFTYTLEESTTATEQIFKHSCLLNNSL
jgi:hypothetical protein